MTIEEINALLTNAKQKAINFNYVEIGKDDLGLPIYEIKYIDNPFTSFKLVRLIEALKIAIVEDLSPQA